MDNNLQKLNDIRVANVIKNLEKNAMKGYHVRNHDELYKAVADLLEENQTVGFGGSMTLFETGLLYWLREENYNLLDRYAEGLTPSDIKDIYRKAFSADAYVTSTNAVTEAGELFNVDGNGNRVAAITWGPDRVIVICGINKIVKDEAAAITRNKTISAPANAIRLSTDTPCRELGYCVDCNSPDRICCTYVMHRKQRVKDRIHVIFVDGEYGF